jgi:hypothetical protein
MPQIRGTTAGYEYDKDGERDPDRVVYPGRKLPSYSIRSEVVGISTNVTSTDGVDAIKIDLKKMVDLPHWDTVTDYARYLAKESYHLCGHDKQTMDALRRYVDEDTQRANGTLDILYRKSREVRNLVDSPSGTIPEALRAPREKAVTWENHIRYLDTTFDQLKDQARKAIDKLKSKKAILEKIKADAESNEAFLKSANGDANINGSNSLNLNKTFNSYLTGRIGATTDKTISNYKELYDTIGLQNEILENTVKKMDDSLLENNRRSNFESKNKDSMYIIYLRMMIGYIILLAILSIKLIFFTKDMTIYKKTIILVLLGVVPFMLPRIEIYVYNMWMFIRSIMTGTVYKL